MSSLPVSGPKPGTGPLTGRVAVITGASRGLGAAIASRLAGDGATTVLWYHSDSDAARLVGKAITHAGGHVVTAQVDVTRRAEVERAAGAVVGEFGVIDVLVNCAGIMRRATFLDITDADWQATLATNLTGYFIVSQVIARIMIERAGGSIVQISSTNDVITSADCTAYASAKGGVAMLTKQMALELGPLGVRTNAVSPGMIETDLNRAELSDESFRRAALSHVPMGRFAMPEDVADAVSFLASDRAKSINGATLRVDAGRTVI
ncbi:SDR family NAD(P)-dependent oxidoreductase [Jatrophihabitans sp. DSM 45814]